MLDNTAILWISSWRWIATVAIRNGYETAGDFIAALTLACIALTPQDIEAIMSVFAEHNAAPIDPAASAN